VVFDEFAQMADLFVFERVEVVATLPSGPQLGQVVIQRFFRNTYLVSGVLKTETLVIEVIVVKAVVEAPPLGHFLDHVCDGALLCFRLLE